MEYAFHTRNVAGALQDLSGLAKEFLEKYGPGKPPDPVLLRAQAAFLQAPQAVTEALCQVTAQVAEDGALSALYSGLLDLSRLSEHHEAISGPMLALVLFGALPEAVAKHKALGVSEAITRDTFQDLLISLELFAAKEEGAFGIARYRWLRNHFEIKLFQVGRLQYIFRPYTGFARAFVNDVTGEVVLTAQEGITFRGDGLMDFEGGPPRQKELPICQSHWVSESAEDGDFVRTNCLLVNGRALQTRVLLDKTVWRLALEEGMHSLNMHIPQGTPLKRADCVDSLRAAWHFFRKLYPDQPFETYNCGSWLLETELQNILSPSSGIVQFLQLFRRYPLKASSWSFVDRVYGGDPATVEDLTAFARTADRGSSLQRGIADYWLAGGRLSSAGGIIHQYDVIRF